MSGKLTHRREIQGLRALAVLAVISNHLFPKLLPGGFLGVDIFFLLSGYLITCQLLELSAVGQIRISLLTFYARRIRRILPSALLVIWVTIWLSYRYLGPVVGNDTLRDGRWATLFFANSHFNSLKLNYFSQGTSAPLLQHYWSLAVEEQFYFIWPIALLFIVLIAKGAANAALPIFIAIVSAASFISIFTTERSLSYLATQTRIWELGMGALVATIGVRKLPMTIELICLTIVLISLRLVTSDSKVPGLVVLPILFATVVLLNIHTGWLQKALSNRVMHYLGDISFVLYLWHWPIIELNRQLATNALATRDLISLAFLIFILAVATHHLFENPLRFNRYLIAHSGLTVIAGLTAIALSVTATYLLVKG